MSAQRSSANRHDPADVASALEDCVDAAIAASDGDARSAVRALIVASGFLEEELRQARAMISRGYSRGEKGT